MIEIFKNELNLIQGGISLYDLLKLDIKCAQIDLQIEMEDKPLNEFTVHLEGSVKNCTQTNPLTNILPLKKK